VSAPGDAEVDAEVRAHLADDDYPACSMCGRDRRVVYMGLVNHAPTFHCAACGCIFAVDLVDAGGAES